MLQPVYKIAAVAQKEELMRLTRGLFLRTLMHFCKEVEQLVYLCQSFPVVHVVEIFVLNISKHY